MTYNEFIRLPRGPGTHPSDCVCHSHEKGVWAGYDPVSGSVSLPNSTAGEAAKARLERRYRVRFRQELGPREWAAAKELHAKTLDREVEARWKRGVVSPYERTTNRFRVGVQTGLWPDVDDATS